MAFYGSQQSSTYRLSILERLEKRERKQRSIQSMFRHYSTLAEQLGRMQRIGSRPYSTADELTMLKEEMAMVFKQKSVNEQDLIEATRRLTDTESQLSSLTIQRNQYKVDNEKLKANIETMEASIAELKHSNNEVNEDRKVLMENCNELSSQRTELEAERVELLAKIQALQEKRIQIMNAEIELEEERKQSIIREQIAKASQDIEYDDERASSAMGHSPETSDEYVMSDFIPQEMKFRINAHDGEVNDIEWMTEDTFLTCSTDSKIRLWRIFNAKMGAEKIGTLTGCTGSINRIDFSSERNVCLAASSDKTCKIWNIRSQRLLTTFSGHGDKLSSAKFHRDHHAITGSFDRTIRLWDVASETCVKTYCTSSVFDVVSKCGPMQTEFASAHFDKKVRLWDDRQNEATHVIELGQRVTSVDVSICGLQLVASSRDDTLTLLDTRTFRVLHLYSSESYQTSSDYSKAIFSPSSEYICAGSANGHLFIWDTKTTKLETVLRTKAEHNAVLSLSWNQSGRGILSCDRLKTCSLWR